jgi:hypothetical protein
MDTGAAGAKAGVASLGGGANAIDINTVEDLGGGLRGGFSSQIRFSAATGDMGSSGTGNALFHAANAYLSGGFGTARIGKIAEASNCGFDAWGCTGGAGFGAGVGTSTLAGASAVANAISYTTPTISGFSASAMSSQSTRAEERQSFTLNYAQGPFAAQYLQTNGTANTAANVLVSATNVADTTKLWSVKDEKAKQSSIAASYNFGVAKLNVLNVKEEGATGTTTKDVTAINGSMPMGAVTLLAGYAKDKKAVANADTKVSLGVNYALSKRSTLGADVFKAEQGANTGSGFVVRMRHTF